MSQDDKEHFVDIRRPMMPLRVRWWLKERRERLMMAIAWSIPGWLAYWAAVRVVAHATTGKWGTTIVPELPAMEALRRWEADGKGMP